MTAFNSGLKTAIPHSMRRNVLIPRFALWPRTPDEDGNCDWKYHKQPDVVEDSDQFLVGHV